jgi:uncharacterized protein DUF3786/putative Fe-S cluster protein
MARPGNVMEILKLLDKSNCKQCGKPTCMAFAAAVFRGDQSLGDCPRLTPEAAQRYDAPGAAEPTPEQEMRMAVQDLQKQVAATDLNEAAKRLGAPLADGVLTVRCLGKPFRVDAHGRILTDIHVNPWIAIPVLNYVLNGTGQPPSGDWVSFRTLEGGKTWYRLFGRRCEKPLKDLADTYTDLFDDLLRLFDGEQVANHYVSDISLVLHPLPQTPILICYWRPEGEMESSLNLFFDSTAEQNLDIQSLYLLCAGLVTMFEKLAATHGN